METALVTVYNFEVPGPCGMVHMPFKATRQTIVSKYLGRVIEGTDKAVSISALDGEGRYFAQPRGWTIERLEAIA